MPAVYDRLDFVLDTLGDFQLGGNGDLEDGSADTIQPILSTIRSLLLAETGDWLADSDFAANLSDFVGEPNSPELAEAIEVRIRSILNRKLSIPTSDIAVRTVPISESTLSIFIGLSALSTPLNSLNAGEGLVIPMLFNTRDAHKITVGNVGFRRTY